MAPGLKSLISYQYSGIFSIQNTKECNIMYIIRRILAPCETMFECYWSNKEKRIYSCHIIQIYRQIAVNDIVIGLKLDIKW